MPASIICQAMALHYNLPLALHLDHHETPDNISAKVRQSVCSGLACRFKQNIQLVREKCVFAAVSANCRAPDDNGVGNAAQEEEIGVRRALTPQNALSFLRRFTLFSTCCARRRGSACRSGARGTAMTRPLSGTGAAARRQNVSPGQKTPRGLSTLYRRFERIIDIFQPGAILAAAQPAIAVLSLLFAPGLTEFCRIAGDGTDRRPD